MALMEVHHNPLAFVFGVLGNIISFIVYLALRTVFYKIFKSKSTQQFQPIYIYLVALFSSMLWLYYGLLKPDVVLLITINSIGCLVESIYIVMYITYASTDATRRFTIQLLAALMVVFATILLVAEFLILDPVLRFRVVGEVCDFVSVAVFAAPLTIMAKVIRTKSVEFMPVALSLFLTISALIWLLYGIFLKNVNIALPNVLGLVLGMLQLILYGCYYKKVEV